MIYRSQIIVCNEGMRDKLVMALEKSTVEKPPGMLDGSFSIDAHDDDTVVILQSWESKKACMDFMASMPSEKKAFFGGLMASRAESWHSAPLSLK